MQYESPEQLKLFSFSIFEEISGSREQFTCFCMSKQFVKHCKMVSPRNQASGADETGLTTQALQIIITQTRSYLGLKADSLHLYKYFKRSTNVCMTELFMLAAQSHNESDRAGSATYTEGLLNQVSEQLKSRCASSQLHHCPAT